MAGSKALYEHAHDKIALPQRLAWEFEAMFIAPPDDPNNVEGEEPYRPARHGCGVFQGFSVCFTSVVSHAVYRRFHWQATNNLISALLRQGPVTSYDDWVGYCFWHSEGEDARKGDRSSLRRPPRRSTWATNSAFKIGSAKA